MKREDISKLFEGATDEQINTLLDINSADIGKAKQKLEAERDNYKTQLETTQNALKEFEGINVKDLQSKVDTLNTTLANKENEYQAKIADMEFNSVLDGAVAASGARDAKAVIPFLDIDALKSSKNQTEDIKSAIEKVKTDKGYLFGADEPINNAVKETNGSITGGASDALRAAMGLLS